MKRPRRIASPVRSPASCALQIPAHLVSRLQNVARWEGDAAANWGWWAVNALDEICALIERDHEKIDEERRRRRTP